MNGSSNGPALLLRAANQDKRVMAEAAGLFEGYQLTASAPGFLSTIVRESNKPFVVDPQTYLFAQKPKRHLDPKKGRPKPGIARLADEYGPPFDRALTERELTPEDFADSAGACRVVERTLEVQRRKCRAGQLGLLPDPYYEKYRVFDDAEPQPSLPGGPLVLVPPFFLVRSPNDPWMGVNLHLTRCALQARQADERIVPTLLFNPGLLTDRDVIARIVAQWSDLPVDGFLLWPNDLIEERGHRGRLAGLAQIVDQLAATGKPVRKLYGGFYSAMLWKRGLQGFSSGLGTATSRNVLFFGGGGARRTSRHKYYIPLLHRSYPIEEARSILEAHPRLRCTCDLCREVYGKSMRHFSEMETKDLCQRHFLIARSEEMRMLCNGGMGEVLAEMRTTYCDLQRHGDGDYEFLNSWSTLAS